MHSRLDKSKLLDLIRAERAFMERTLALMRREQMVTPMTDGGWTVKDTLAHISAWEQLCLGWIEAAHRGETPETPAPGFTWDEIDRLNEKIHQDNQGRALDEVLANSAWSYQQMLGTVEALPEEELFTPKYYQWLYADDPLWLYVAHNSYIHYEEHIVAMRAWLMSQPGADQHVAS